MFGVLCVVLFASVDGAKLVTDYGNEYDPIEEIQHAACRIATEEIQATANATITRQLKGVCTSKELTNKLEKLENRLIKEIESLKNVMETGRSAKVRRLASTAVKSVDKNSVHGNRDNEIAKYNATTHINGRDTEYQYYWRINNARNMLEQQEVISSNFYVAGMLYYIKMVPRFMGTKYATVELKAATPIKKFHRFTIFDPENAKYDVSSQLLSSLHIPAFKISGDKLRKFIRQDVLIVKLVLFI